MDEFDEHACEFKNELGCEEELNEENLGFDEIEAEYFNEEDY